MSCKRTLAAGVAWQRRLVKRGAPVDLARRAPGRDAQAERRGRTPRREAPAALREFAEHRSRRQATPSAQYLSA
jgi:hypothetical protein